MLTIVHVYFSRKDDRYYFSSRFVLVISIIGMVLLIPPAFFLFLVSGTMVTGHKGIEFDQERNRFRSYISVFYIKFGTWKHSDAYPYIYILRSYRFPAIGSKGLKEGQWPGFVDIILTDAGYREKIVLSPAYTEEKGRQKATELATLLGKKFVPYRPESIRNDPRKRKGGQ